jgi:hypothetical protein
LSRQPKADVTLLNFDFRFTPKSGQRPHCIYEYNHPLATGLSCRPQYRWRGVGVGAECEAGCKKGSPNDEP